MNVRHRVVSTLALVICVALVIPPDVAAQAAQSAGKITAVVPIVNVIRGPQQVAASTSQQVFWGDVINSGHLARARIALDDGSILNVGSDTNLAITKHDASQQQTDLDLNYGRVRAKATKLVKPDARFQIRTSVGVAGVVGTEMAVIFEPNGVMQVVCIEGACKVCDVAVPPHCVLMKGGQQSSVRSNEQPSQPVQVTPMNMTEAVNSTAGAGAGAGGGIGVTAGVVAGVSAAVATTVAVVVVRVVTRTQTCGTPAPAGVRADCTKIAAVGKINGQRVP